MAGVSRSGRERVGVRFCALEQEILGPQARVHRPSPVRCFADVIPDIQSELKDLYPYVKLMPKAGR